MKGKQKPKPTANKVKNLVKDYHRKMPVISNAGLVEDSNSPFSTTAWDEIQSYYNDFIKNLKKEELKSFLEQLVIDCKNCVLRSQSRITGLKFKSTGKTNNENKIKDEVAYIERETQMQKFYENELERCSDKDNSDKSVVQRHIEDSLKGVAEILKPISDREWSERKPARLNPNSNLFKELEWINKTELCELIYALGKSQRIRRKGKPLKQKELIELFEKIFNINLSAFHDLLREGLNSYKRDKDNKLFLRELVNYLQNRQTDQ